jgi:hypothetical protein
MRVEPDCEHGNSNWVVMDFMSVLAKRGTCML